MLGDELLFVIVEREVLIIFAANEGYLDKLSVDEVRNFEKELYSFVESRHKDLLDEIRGKREISDDLRKKLVAALDDFMKGFAPNKN